MKKKELHFHNLKDGAITGPYSDTDEICQLIQDLSLNKDQFVVMETIITREELCMDSAYSIFLHKKKKKKADIETEALTEKNLVFVTGEVKQ